MDALLDVVKVFDMRSLEQVTISPIANIKSSERDIAIGISILGNESAFTDVRKNKSPRKNNTEANCIKDRGSRIVRQLIDGEMQSQIIYNTGGITNPRLKEL